MASRTGIVKWFNAEKGYGFISCDEGDDVFAHHSQIKENGPEKDLHEGESVTFDIQDGEKGPMATNIQKL
ncbi:cold shock domain-containing protein [Clostridium botulinum]|uniref:Conserved domain protein n=1 Tax=Clostridium botulinum (strain Eklund 17B / Type B) TaxID=935198 RepID=B2TJX2_CLOBB|nr:cold shock domain-containing protein [Clostridium sp. VAP51]ACD25079.1 conserved domain protein [Clostridium botulinum B str. Eklund 17B (NRP)]MBY6974674.1 cold shock domain-containing protein [Clostridium botulinum]MBY6999660.1 cold shock domain-containing protein [Clostridium botulinum]MCR1275106.1 cold shock domain-containing protein [Clostridium botulinum]NFD70641.1 cold shock domain-containing protein [Clostridium botulinum]